MTNLNEILSHSITKNEHKGDSLFKQNKHHYKNKLRTMSPECKQQLESIVHIKTRDLTELKFKKKIESVDLY